MITICHKRAFLDKIEGKIIRKTARRISFLPFMRDFRLHHTTNRYVHDVVNGEFLVADVEVSNASEPSVRCSKRSSSDSASFSPNLSLRNPLRPHNTPADWMARIRPGLLLQLKKGHKALFASEALDR